MKQWTGLRQAAVAVQLHPGLLPALRAKMQQESLQWWKGQPLQMTQAHPEKCKAKLVRPR